METPHPVVELEDDDEVQMQTFSAKELSEKRMSDALAKGDVIDLCDVESDEEPAAPPPAPQMSRPLPLFEGIEENFGFYELMSETKTTLKNMCRERRLKVSGNKNDLVLRLMGRANLPPEMRPGMRHIPPSQLPHSLNTMLHRPVPYHHPPPPQPQNMRRDLF